VYLERKVRKKYPEKRMVKKSHRLPNVLGGSNLEARGMGVQSVLTFPVKKNMFISRKPLSALNVVWNIYPMEIVGEQKLLRSRLRLIRV